MEISPLSATDMNNTRRALERCDARSPLATVVIPAYNEQDHIAHTLHSVARAVFNASHKANVIVVANACTDDTAGIAERLGARVIAEDRKGVSYARQKGLEAAQGPLVLNTDADTEVGLEWINGHLRHYDQRQTVGVAGPCKFRNAHWSYHMYKGGAWLVHTLGRPFLGRPRGHYGGANSSYRRQTALSFGGFAPGVDLGEDSELGERLSERGTVIEDRSPDIAVTTSGRRFESFELVMKEMTRKLSLLMKGKLYAGHIAGETFEDIR